MLVFVVNEIEEAALDVDLAELELAALLLECDDEEVLAFAVVVETFFEDVVVVFIEVVVFCVELTELVAEAVCDEVVSFLLDVVVFMLDALVFCDETSVTASMTKVKEGARAADVLLTCAVKVVVEWKTCPSKVVGITAVMTV